MTLEETITNEKKKAVEFAKIAEQLFKNAGNKHSAGENAYIEKAKYHKQLSEYLKPEIDITIRDIATLLANGSIKLNNVTLNFKENTKMEDDLK